MHTGRTRRFFEWLLEYRWSAVAATCVITAVLAACAARVRADYSIEMAFPRFDVSRVDYERYKTDFPFDDTAALVVVEAPDIFTLAGLARIAALERHLASIEGVVDTQSLTSAHDIVSDGATIRTEPLVPSPDLTAREIAHVRRTATSDPLFAWRIAPPDGRATTIQVTLTPDYARHEARRTAFLLRAREVIAEHDRSAADAGVTQRLTLSGLPVIRSEFTELITRDVVTLFPVALGIVLVLLLLSFRSATALVASFVTILASVVWVIGFMGMAGITLQVMTQIMPIIVIIVSISDTSHILADIRERQRQGAGGREALVSACAANALPCLLTEITIAAGFAGLAFNDMVMIQEFGITTAVGAMCAWIANMTVLPLSLSILGAKQQAHDSQNIPWLTTTLDRFVGLAAHIVAHRPRWTVATAFLIVVGSTLLGLRVGWEYYSYDDLRPDRPIAQNLRRVEAIYGGSVPMAIFIEPTGPREPNAMLDPEALALIDRVTTRLKADFPDELRHVGSVSDYVRKAHRLFAVDEPDAGDLPRSRRLAAQELAAVEEPRILRHLLSADRATAAVVAMVPDSGSTRASEMIRALRAAFDREESTHPYRITVTGVYGLADGIYRSLVGGLARSLGWAVFISFIVFTGVLRSWRLALIALVPNLLPLLVLLGLMSLLAIDLKPTTVVIFSIALVIADDDTIQYLARFREAYGRIHRTGAADPHRVAALETLRHSGPPMLITAGAVAIGFSTLLLSGLLALANLGLLMGLALLVAVVTDLFLTPVMLMALRPRMTADAPGLEAASAIRDAVRGA